MEAHRIAVISDTHGTLRPEVAEYLGGCEAVFHAGDLGRSDVLERLRKICPVYAVRGNVDGDWAGELPEELECTLFGFRIYMIHNRKKIAKDLADADIVIYGQSHQYEERAEGRTRYLNPGSCGPRRFRLPVTMMVLILYPAEHRLETKRVEWEISGRGKQYGKRAELDSKGTGKQGGNSGAAGMQAKATSGRDTDFLRGRDLHGLIKKIMKEMRSGRTVAQIAARNQVDEEFAEQVCRFYVTHPGVDVDGILDRMERKNL